jgi:NADH dehydrogenase FAD-containing subunit
MASNKIEILVLGGGGFGAELTYRLAPLLDASKHNLTMISPRPFVQHLMAAARTYVTDEDGIEEYSLIPYDSLFGPGRVGSFKLGIAEHVDFEKRVVTLVGGEEIGFDHLALATGSTWPGGLNLPVGPDSREESRKFLKEWRKRVADAKRICIIGGGAVGIGELVLLPSSRFTVFNVALQKLPERSGITTQRPRSRTPLELKLFIRRN